MHQKVAAGTLLGMLLVGGCVRSGTTTAAGQVDASYLHKAVQHVSDVIVYDIVSPPQASRVYAYSSIAAYEALRFGDTTYRSFAAQLTGLTPVPRPDGDAAVSFAVAGVHAYLTVGRALTFSRERMDSLRRSVDQEMRASGMSAAVFERSIAYGEEVAKHILAWAGSDGFKEARGLPTFSVTNDSGRWIPTPPAYMDAVEPNWGTLRPMVMDSSSQFRADPPLVFETTKGSPFFREVMEVYTIGRGLTEEQRAMAAFWDCNPYVMHVQGHTMFATKKISPGGHWMGVAGIASRKSGADPLRSAEVYALTAIALFEGFLSVWETKYATNVIRPETVINSLIDVGWEPLLQTPPFPEYTSGHSVISTAAATVLTSRFGDGFAYVDSTELSYGLPARPFGSFNEAAAEAAISRLYGGIHYRRAIEQGQRQGRRVGDLIVQRVHTGAAAQVAVRVAPTSTFR
ncbi:MAG: vanadium-dependent haloperoxidase [Gemmatimonadaceae bacterium]